MCTNTSGILLPIENNEPPTAVAATLNDRSMPSAIDTLIDRYYDDEKLLKIEVNFDMVDGLANARVEDNYVYAAMVMFYALRRIAHRFKLRAQNHIGRIYKLANSSSVRARPADRQRLVSIAETCASKIEEQEYHCKVIETWIAMQSPFVVFRIVTWIRSVWYSYSDSL